MRLALPVLAFALVASPTLANPETPKSEKPEEKVICKGKRDLAFGSHRRAGKECRTEAEWKELETATKRELQSFRERSQTRGDAQGR
ncbi:MAG TPA: hypothetical protein VFR36_01125 [Sphingomicrobium sp.]|nr:hypothetical protein [Sphingomicrobium sp.]